MANEEPTFRRHGGREPVGEPAMSGAGGFFPADQRGLRPDQANFDRPTFGRIDSDRDAAVDESRARSAPPMPSFGPGSRTAPAPRTSPEPKSVPEPRTDPEARTNSAAASNGYDDTDVAGREIGRDRLKVHLGWEFLLLLATVAVGVLLYRFDPASLKQPALDTLLVSGTILGLLTLGAGLSLRAGVANLAVGPIAIAAALHFAENGDRGLLQAAAPAVGIAAIGGLVMGLVVVVFHVPGWATTLAAAMGAMVFIQLRTGPVNVQGGFDPSHRAIVLFSGFAALAVLGGSLGTVAPIRQLLGRLRPDGDPAVRRGAAAALPVIGSLIVSSALAVVAGILLASNSATTVAPTTGLQWTGLSLGLALFAGTSAFGRRGGIFGTLLVVTGMTLFLDYAHRAELGIAPLGLAAGAIAAGLIVTRLVERYGRPLTELGDDWQPQSFEHRSEAIPDTWSPAEPPTSTRDRWLDDRWGQSPR